MATLEDYLTFGSLFAGIGGFDLGFERAGMRCAWSVEIDDKCNEVRAHHWPDVKQYKDVCNVGRDNLEPVDVICGGFPCQDLSVAGRRAGLAGERSGLWWEFHRIIEELQPRWAVIENVPGLLSSNSGRDMGTIIGALGKLRYGYAWATLDAQYFGLAQRRRRVFIVGCLGDWRGATQVLFEPESGCRDSAPSRETGERVAGTIAAGAHPSGFNGYDAERGNIVARPLAFGRTTNHYDESQQSYVVQHALSGNNQRNDPDGECFIITQNGSDIQVSKKPGSITAGIARQTSGPVVAFQSKASSTNSMNPSDISPSLDVAKAGGTVVAFPGMSYVGWAPPSMPIDKDKSGPLDTRRAQCAQGPFGVRRLTPLECERLQGFPDAWTAVNGMSDSARYRMLGNAVAVPVAKWIGHRIMEVEYDHP